MAMVLDKIPSWRVGSVDVGGVTRQTIKEVLDDDVSGLSAEMTYRTLLALFPFLLFLAGLTSAIDTVFNIPDLTDQIVNKAGEVMPEDAQSVLRSFTDELVTSQGAGAIIFGLLGSLWAASSAVGTAMKALNRIYDVEETRPFLKKTLLQIGLTLIFGGLIVVATLLFATGGLLAGGIGDLFGWNEQVSRAWSLVTPVLAFALILLAVGTLFWLGPASQSQFHWVTPGALVFLVGWLIFTVLFALYLSNFGSYNRVYGSLAAVIILLIWLYWTNMILFIAAELNAVLAQRYDDEYREQSDAR
jgi:membrane protein